jgi:hypothetical protein
MALKTFKSANGTTWSVWRIDASVGRDVRGMPKAWLVFQDEAGTERRRLVSFPDHWETLSEAGLAQLCATATPAREWGRPSPPGGMASVDELAELKPED